MDLISGDTPSKINLYLKITGKRSNGYHELESLFLPLAEPCDSIAIDPEALPGAITVGCSDIMIPGGNKNIAGKAAELWAKKAAAVMHWDINILKNIPVAAGMGGGSSDAAKVLTLLNSHYNNKLTDDELQEAALSLGADVPFFLDPVPAIMTGIGETASPLDFKIPELNILLISPGFPVSAAEGYKLMPPEKISVMNEDHRKELLNSLRSGDIEKFSSLIFNDLQDGVFNKYPILEVVSSAVKNSGALTVLMTGSGPTLFGIYPDKQTREKAAEELSAIYSEFRIIKAAMY